jgi:hypothetical protein
VGGCVTNYISLPQTWVTTTIPSPSLQWLSCTSDLTNVHILFAVSANASLGPGAANILLDNIQFLPVPAIQATATSLPLSTQTFGVVPQGNYPIGLIR